MSPYRRLAVVTALGFSSGLPLALTDSTLQAWLTVEGVDIRTIGLLSLVGLPYVLKFLWAPVLDRFELTRLGRRRGWMLLTQFCLALTIGSLALTFERGDLAIVAFLALFIAALSATQDIAIDAYRTEILREQERGLGVGLSVAAYRLAMIATGAGALFIADHLGFDAAYVCFALLMSVGIIASLSGREAPVEVPTTTMIDTVVQPFRAFLRLDGALSFLMLIVLYKLGDAFAAKLTTTFFIRELQFTLTEVGAFYKTAGLIASIGGGVLGGIVMFRITLFQALLWFGTLQMVTNLGFVVLALVGKSYVAMLVVVIFENLFGGMGTAAFVALIMALCDTRFTATQFALLTAIASLGRVVIGPLSGELVAQIGWVQFFLFSVAVALLPVMMVIFLRTAIERLEVSGEA